MIEESTERPPIPSHPPGIYPLSDNAVLAGLLRLRTAFATSILRISRFVEAHPWSSFLCLLLVVVPAILGHSIDRPLWHDEFFTYSISQEPTIRELLRVNRLIDLVPPLSFLLTRFSYFLFGVNTLTTRLPEIAGFFLAMTSLFLFAKRRMGGLFGVLAATLFFTGAALPLAAEARPYGLLLGFGALGLLAWQIARENRRLGIPLLLVSAFGMLLSHVFSAFLWAALAAAEGVRILQRRRVDWPLVVAWTVPLISVLTWIPLLRTHGEDIYPLAFQASTRAIPSVYADLTLPSTLPILCTALAVLAVLGRNCLRGGKSWFFSHSEWTAVLLILTIPAIVVVQLARSHAAFFSRYGAAGTLSVAVVGIALLGFWTGSDLRAALGCILLALWVSGEGRFAAHSVVHSHIFTRTEPVLAPCPACLLSAKIDPSLPLVDASGLAFVEMSYRENASTLSRVFYLTDPQASTEYAHANIFEGMALEKELLHLGGNVTTYPDFIRQHHRFFVFGDYGYPEDWLLRKLMADGATLQLMGSFPSDYESHELYEVTR